MKQSNSGYILWIVKCMPIWTIISRAMKVGLTKSWIGCPWFDFFNEWWKIKYSTNTTQFQESMIFAQGYALMSLLSKAYTH